MIKQRKKRDCSCSGHPRGRPHYSHGPCYGFELRPAVRERIAGRRLERAWQRSVDPESEDF